MPAPLQVLVLLGLPSLALLAVRRLRLAALVGPVVLCYSFGVLLGNLPGLALGLGSSLASGLTLDASLSLSLAEAAIPLAIPLLLFPTNLPRWLRLARSTLLSFSLACAASMASALVWGRWFSRHSDEAWKMAGMLASVYIGGPANMSAVGLALDVRQETFVLLNTADALASGLYLLFVLTVAQRLALRWLPPFPSSSSAPSAPSAPSEPSPLEPAPSEAPLPLRTRVRGMALALLLSAAIAAASAGLTHLVWGQAELATVFLLLTTLGLGASLLPPVRHLPGGPELGDYLLLVFCVALGTLTDARKLLETGPVLALTCGVVALAFALHCALARLFRIDADTLLITSTATILGPPFIGPVARALNNREVLVSGMTSGLVGYAAGTWLGLLTAWLLAP